MKPVTRPENDVLLRFVLLLNNVQVSWLCININQEEPERTEYDIADIQAYAF